MLLFYVHVSAGVWCTLQNCTLIYAALFDRKETFSHFYYRGIGSVTFLNIIFGSLTVNCNMRLIKDTDKDKILLYFHNRPLVMVFLSVLFINI